jgi:hypothetical protein
MGGRPRIHASGSEQVDVGHYKLNLSEQQLNQVASLLNVEPGSDFDRSLRDDQGTRQPSEGQELLITYKGRYVRIRYQQGQAQVIDPNA